MTDKAGEPKPKKRVVRLDDLVPRQDVVGGAGKFVFGEGVVEKPGERDHADRPARDRAGGPRARG